MVVKPGHNHDSRDKTYKTDLIIYMGSLKNSRDKG